MAPEVRDGGSRNRLLSLDETLEILSNYQRRAILQHLRDSPDAVHSMDEVVRNLREIEQEKRSDPPGAEHLLSVLVHIHGPKLDDAGLVDYDLPNSEIRYHPRDHVEELLEQIERAEEAFDDC